MGRRSLKALVQMRSRGRRTLVLLSGSTPAQKIKQSEETGDDKEKRRDANQKIATADHSCKCSVTSSSLLGRPAGAITWLWALPRAVNGTSVIESASETSLIPWSGRLSRHCGRVLGVVVTRSDPLGA